jgi:hypothetical protein
MRCFPLRLSAAMILFFAVGPPLTLWSIANVGLLIDGKGVSAGTLLFGLLASIVAAPLWYILPLLNVRGVLVTWLPTAVAALLYWRQMRLLQDQSRIPMTSRFRYLVASILTSVIVSVASFWLVGLAFRVGLSSEGLVGFETSLPAIALVGAIVGTVGGCFMERHSQRAPGNA